MQFGVAEKDPHLSLKNSYISPLLQSECLCMLSCFSCVWLFATPWTWAHGPTRLLCPWDSSDKNTGVGSHVLSQGTFLIDLSDLPGIEPVSSKFCAMAGVFFTTRASYEAPECLCFSKIHMITFSPPKVVVLGIWEMIRSWGQILNEWD